MSKGTPLELIRKGIAKGSWELVGQGYTALTGEEVKLGNVEINFDTAKFINELQEVISRYNKETVAEVVQKKLPKPKRQSKQVSQESISLEEEATDSVDPQEEIDAVRKGVKKNRFVDNTKLARADLKDSQDMSKAITPSERRPTFVKSKVECIKCHKHFEVHPELAVKNTEGDNAYVCKNCVGLDVRA